MLKIICAAIMAVVTTTTAQAAQVTYTPREDKGYVSIDGTIVEGDAAKLKRIISTKEVTTVFLASNGGSLPEALEIGRVINVSSYRTVVLADTICASSCALIWLSGNPRFAQPRSHIGFHASYTMEGGRPIASAMANAMVGRYLTLLNLPARAVIFATSATPENMLWMNTAKPGSEGISYEVIEPSQPATTSPRTASTPIASAKAASPARSGAALEGKVYGKWSVFVRDAGVGAMTKTTSQDSWLVYACLNGKNCRYAIRVPLSCDAGDEYAFEYQVDGYSRKTLDLTCDEDGRTLYPKNTQAFRSEISGEVGINIYTESEKKVLTTYRFSLIGYDQAIDALKAEGYIQPTAQ